MRAAQSIADGMEDAHIRRYLARRRGGSEAVGLRVSCPHCASSQVVHPAHGTRQFSLICFACGHRTLIDLAAI
jgi:ribosomal protein S27E